MAVCSHTLSHHLLPARLSRGTAHPSPGPAGLRAAGCSGTASGGHWDSSMIVQLVKKTRNLF